jgi:hypothetical protein
VTGGPPWARGRPEIEKAPATGGKLDNPSTDASQKGTGMQARVRPSARELRRRLYEILHHGTIGDRTSRIVGQFIVLRHPGSSAGRPIETFLEGASWELTEVERRRQSYPLFVRRVAVTVAAAHERAEGGRR